MEKKKKWYIEVDSLNDILNLLAGHHSHFNYSGLIRNKQEGEAYASARGFKILEPPVTPQGGLGLSEEEISVFDVVFNYAEIGGIKEEARRIYCSAVAKLRTAPTEGVPTFGRSDVADSVVLTGNSHQATMLRSALAGRISQLNEMIYKTESEPAKPLWYEGAKEELAYCYDAFNDVDAQLKARE